MTSAKITRCNHYFHGVCLRKWLYVQDRCPFCHEIIMNQDTVVVGAEPRRENVIDNHNDIAVPNGDNVPNGDEEIPEMRND